MSKVRGYKVFNPDWTYNGFPYQIEECYEMDEKPIVHNKGFHFCRNLIDCYDSCDFSKENKVAEITAYGEIDTDERTYYTNKIKIERELKWEEVLSIVNTGKSCIGLGNTGYKNIGYYNTGSENNGNKNNGHRNYGDHNSGHYNIGNHNSGNFNIGDYNTGDCNEGKYNSGDSNKGNFNTGDLNNTNYSNGCFNTIEPNIYLFNNKLSNWTLYDWRTSEAHKILQRIRQYPRDWKIKDLITKEEMIQIRQQRWNQLDKKEKEVIRSIPNFDKNIFKEITGIDVEEQ